MDYNPLDPDVKKNPYPYYAELRREHPVFSVEAFTALAISRYDDVSYVLNNPALFSSDGFGQTNINGRETKMLISADPPDHTRLRGLVNRAFTPRMVADLEPRIREVTNELLDAVAARGSIELVDDFAIPLPVTIIAEILGVEPERQADFKKWSDSVVAVKMTQEDLDAHELLMQEFIDYFGAVIEERRKEPKDDMISLLVQAEDREEALTADELITFTLLLLVAGNETTTNLIGNMMRALLAHPDQLEAVRNDPSLIANTIEEALRYDAPVQFLFRRATEDVEIEGTSIPKDTIILPIFASANRDDSKYQNGERFDIRRNTQGHMAFGHGIHFCLGAPLARLEGAIALEAMLARLDNIAHADGDIEVVDSPFLRGPKHLPLTFELVAETVKELS